MTLHTRLRCVTALVYYCTLRYGWVTPRSTFIPCSHSTVIHYLRCVLRFTLRLPAVCVTAAVNLRSAFCFARVGALPPVILPRLRCLPLFVLRYYALLPTTTPLPDAFYVLPAVCTFHVAVTATTLPPAGLFITAPPALRIAPVYRTRLRTRLRYAAAAFTRLLRFTRRLHRVYLPALPTFTRTTHVSRLFARFTPDYVATPAVVRSTFYTRYALRYRYR